MLKKRLYPNQTKDPKRQPKIVTLKLRKGWHPNPVVMALNRKLAKLERKWARLELRAKNKFKKKHQENAFKIQKARLLKAAEAVQRKLKWHTESA